MACATVLDYVLVGPGGGLRCLRCDGIGGDFVGQGLVVPTVVIGCGSPEAPAMLAGATKGGSLGSERGSFWRRSCG